jgi:hypothetical protein
MPRTALLIIDMLNDVSRSHASQPWPGVGGKVGLKWLTPSALMRAGLRPRG